MPSLLYFFCFVAILQLFGLASEVQEENYLIELDDKNFDSELQDKDVYLILFYSLKCRNCSELESKLSSAAKLLLSSPKHSPRVGLGRLDAAASPLLATRHGAAADTTLPTLKLFKRQTSSAAVDYTGPVDSAEAIAEHLRSTAAAAADSGPQRLTEAGLSDALARQATWLVAFADVGSASSLDYALEGLRSAASELRPGKQVAIGYADARGDEEAMAGRLGLRTDLLPVFALLRRDEPGWATPFSHQPSAINLAKFCRAHMAQSGAVRVFVNPAEFDSLNSGLDAHLVASEEAAAPVRHFLAAFLAESGFFYERRLEGGLLAASAAQLLDMSPDAIYVRRSQILLSSGESGMARYPGPLHSTPALKTFFDRRSLPRLGVLAWHNRRAYMSAGRPVCLFYTSLPGGWQGEAGQLARRTHARLAAMVTGRESLVLFALADEGQLETDESGRFGFDESSTDVNLGCYDSARRRFAMPESDGPDPAAVHSFLDSFAAGTAPQRIRSASVPMATAGQQRNQVFVANAEKLKQLLADASAAAARLLLIQCDFSAQPCGQSLKEFAAAAADSALRKNAVAFVRVDTKFNDLPGELYYRFEGEAAIELTSKQPQVLLLLPRETEPPRVTRYEREVVSKAYLLQFLAEMEGQGRRHQEL